MKQLSMIGRDTYIDVMSNIKNVPAKIDTGADGSAIWASDIHLDRQGRLVFKLFDKGSPFYTGKVIKRKDFSVARVKSASGDVTIKFKTPIRIKLGGRAIRVNFGLCDRSTHTYPVLIGRRTLHNKFLVDVSRSPQYVKPPLDKTLTLNQELKTNPEQFYQKYFVKEDL